MSLSDHDTSVALAQPDAKRLASILLEMSKLLEMTGPNRLSDAQVTALSEGQVRHRQELAEWTRKLSSELRQRLRG